MSNTLDSIHWPRLLAVLVLSLYFITTALDPFSFSIIGTFNLIMHEAGHWIFGIFGQVIGALGGSIMQVLVPAVFAGYFWSQKQVIGVVFCVLWMGQNLIEVATYAGDAIAMQLPLLGGEAVFHDWNWILRRFDALQHTETIARIFSFIGWLLITVGIIFGLSHAQREH